jgi:predicted metal-binding membrane protein
MSPNHPKMQGSQPAHSAIERLLRHDRMIVAVAVVLLVGVAGVYTLLGVGMNMSAIEMTSMASSMAKPMAMTAHLNPANWVLLFLMWWIMMVAMMTPSAVPLLMLFTAVKRQGHEAHRAASYTGFLLLGYLVTWAFFSAVATALQCALQEMGFLSGPMMIIKSQTVAGVFMVFVGVYQFTSIKNACLSHCRAPTQFIAQHHSQGSKGALKLGLHHGVYCLGCCWALMALLFVGGVMNLYWIAGLTLYVLLEKGLPQGKYIARIAGGGLIAVGLYVLVNALLER